MVRGDEVLMMCRCLPLVFRWGCAADLWHYPPLHGPLQRAEGPDGVVVYLFPWGLADLGGLSGILRAGLGLRCHSWEPMISPPGHSLPSLRGTPADHHDAGNPGSPLPRRWRLPPESVGEGVLHSDQALWEEKQEGGKDLTVTHGKWNGSCIVKGVVIGKWPGWPVSGWWRGQHIWDLISYRAGAIWCPSLTARPSVQVGNGGLRTYEGLLSSCACALLAGVDGEHRPRPTRSLGTSNPLMVFLMVPQTRGTGVAGNRVRTGREWVQWMVGAENSERTWPSQWTGSKSPGGHGRRFVGNGQFPESFSPFVWGWYPDDKLMVTPRSLKNPFQTRETNCGPWSDTMSSGMPKYLKTELNNNSAVSMAVGRPLRGRSRQDFENRSTITSMHVLPPESGRSVIKSTPRCDHGRLGTGNGRSLPAGKWRGLLEIAQSMQPWTNLLTSLAMLGHQ